MMMIKLNSAQANAVRGLNITGKHNRCFPRKAKDGNYYMNKTGTHDMNRSLLNGLGVAFPLVDSSTIVWEDEVDVILKTVKTNKTVEETYKRLPWYIRLWNKIKKLISNGS